MCPTNDATRYNQRILELAFIYAILEGRYLHELKIRLRSVISFCGVLVCDSCLLLIGAGNQVSTPSSGQINNAVREFR